MKTDRSPDATAQKNWKAILKRRGWWVLPIVLAGLAAMTRWMPLSTVPTWAPMIELYGVRPNPPRSVVAARIVAAARAQIGTRYDAAYLPMAFPGGDVPVAQGACTDVVIRALRAAGVDLQLLIHRDISARFAHYPKMWGLSAPNPNIDHRRVPNQIVFLKRFGRELTRQVDQSTLKQWQPGDIVYWRSGPQRWHTGILSDRVDAAGVPLVIHNGSVCIEDNCLTRWPIIGHFRFPQK